ncbi:MAG: hypothetical protein WCI53_02010 [Bacteroidota bacterium]|jgi:SAM-dependent MidA family methyltransferase
MLIKISKPITKSKLDEALNALKKKRSKKQHKSLIPFFAISNESTDALVFQKAIRNEWD